MENIIKIKNLNKTYITKNGSLTALDNINLDIQKGEIFGIIGLSGAGKSTYFGNCGYHEAAFRKRHRRKRLSAHGSTAQYPKPLTRSPRGGQP